jgi:hypothetical protein
LPTDALAEWVQAELENEPETTPLAAVHSAGRLAAGARAAVTTFWPKSREASETLVAQLATDDSAAMRIAAAGALGQLIELASPIDRIEIVCRWTIAEDPRKRLTVARALALPTQVFVADLAIRELAGDSNVEVRAAAARAARVHALGDPAGFEQILSELAADPAAAVRAAVSEAGPRRTV